MSFGASTEKSFKPKAGAFRKRVAAKSGQEFLSGYLEVTDELLTRIETLKPSENGKKYLNLLAFNNLKRENSNDPDYNLFISEDR